MRKHRLLVLWVLVLLVRTEAFGQAHLTHVVTFGDSLTHNDLLWRISGNPQDMYGADPMEAVFNKGAGSDEELTSYAVGGSESSDLGMQIRAYQFQRMIGHQDKATFFSFEIGGNDILYNIKLLASFTPGTDTSADEVIDSLISNIREDLFLLCRSHPQAQFVIWTIPDVTLTPLLYSTFDPDEADNVLAHIELVNQIIREIDQYPFVVVLDLFSLIQEVAAEPPVLFGHQLEPPPAYGYYYDIYADRLHPTAVTNALIANIIIDGINKKWGDNILLYTQEELADLAQIPY